MSSVKEREKPEKPGKPPSEPVESDSSSPHPTQTNSESSLPASSTATSASHALDNETGDASDDQSDSDGFSAGEAPEEDSESDPEDEEVEQNDESLASTIVQEIDEGTYVCLVCTCEIDRHSKVWNCRNCYRVYDLDCIRDWAQRGSSTTEQKTWRCPACSFEQKKLPSSFTCWCGRITNPKADSLIPFSCGNPCNKKYPHCVHSCSSVCHPGKHPECGAMGPVMNCKCGKHKQQLPCMVTPYKAGWQCEEPCKTKVCMLGHDCSKGQCHSGFCGPCKTKIDVSCYCGQKEMNIQCKEFHPEVSYKNDEKFIGGAKCDSITIQYYDCGEHFEELECQPLAKDKPHCKFATDVVNSCYCGKTPFDSLKRTKCTDPMPACENVCGKKLKCGCFCRAQCHDGPCVCTSMIETKCECQSNSFIVPCKALQQGFKPRCLRKCSAPLSCRQHTHRERCCPYEQVALKREREVKKQLRNKTRTNFDDQVLTMEPVHICTRTCNQLKSCGLHRCEALCHSGPCGVCYESSNDDLVCNCGKTVIPAPVRCGTKIECHEQCIREKSCGHPQEPHECHEDDSNCPRCTTLVTKKCNCGDKEIKKVMCSIESVSCGKICTVKKDCGHPCNRACSKDCTEGKHADVATCHSLCRKIRKTCPHICVRKCHYAFSSPCDSFKCNQPIEISCMCGRITREVSCGASNAQETRIGTILECNEDCGRVKREEELRQIFNVSPKAFENPYVESTLDVFKRQKNWCSKMEKIMRDFVSDYQDLKAAGAPAKNSYHFPPMTKPQRDFIKEVASSYKLYSESQDKEPTRAVFIVVTERTEVPKMTILQAIEKEREIELKKLQLEELKLTQLDEKLYNSLMIRDTFFGVNEASVKKAVSEILSTHEGYEEFDIKCMKESTFVFYAPSLQEMDKEKEDNLYMLSKTFKSMLREKLIAFDCKMCLVDDDITEILKVDNNNVMTNSTGSSGRSTPKVEGSEQNSYEILQNS
ncbi:hypothetical protein FT663_01374 [Candidozyma haemuli var. vulneris]|uniref:R3H domain-containing protein n=1 Tax=Candidozyma haemuli TaxID=45357 RepID=A0A2V1AYV1_9ASCO|nr:hypothetical protein CXQ85_002784 [[Candida] haemuloni]KAF3992509.1 hypothetical protein FT662_01055 [[Candida] haemuloni var. vulneris]KAF3994461.1 hypothetical protein FT663_01374 [[Candida] haemuloni var. vulneris]PVH23058.1 hypothetical protein CXQ85_002784 [[Candida] haemuloni]